MAGWSVAVPCFGLVWFGETFDCGKNRTRYGRETWQLRKLTRSHGPSWFIYQVASVHFKCIPGTEESAFVIYFHCKEPFYKRGTKEREKIPLPGT